MALVKLNNRGVRNVSTFGSVTGGSLTFIKKVTASSSGTISFVNGTSDVVFDSTYKEYLFTFKDMHPEEDNKKFAFQVDTGTNTSYNQTITSTAFSSANSEPDDYTLLGYNGSEDQAQGTAFQPLIVGNGNGNDESFAGYLHIFNPSDATYVKHFIARFHTYHFENIAFSLFTAGYVNTTTALTRVQFKMLSGDIDAGDICLYGIK